MHIYLDTRNVSIDLAQKLDIFLFSLSQYLCALTYTHVNTSTHSQRESVSGQTIHFVSRFFSLRIFAFISVSICRTFGQQMFQMFHKMLCSQRNTRERAIEKKIVKVTAKNNEFVSTLLIVQSHIELEFVQSSLDVYMWPVICYFGNLHRCQAIKKEKINGNNRFSSIESFIPFWMNILARFLFRNYLLTVKHKPSSPQLIGYRLYINYLRTYVLRFLYFVLVTV